MIDYKDIPGYEGYYQAGTDGSVRSITKEVRQHSGSTQTKTGKILRPAKDRIGYLNCALSKCNNLASYKVHRLVALAHIENPNHLPEINHKNGIKTDNRVDNLEWCNRSQNIQHAIKHKLLVFKKGADNAQSKFTQEQRAEIVSLMKSGVHYSLVAEKMNCHFGTIYKILKAETI